MSLSALKDGQIIMLMGSAEALPAPPAESARPRFIEDMKEEEVAAAGAVLPAGHVTVEPSAGHVSACAAPSGA